MDDAVHCCKLYCFYVNTVIQWSDRQRRASAMYPCNTISSKA